MDEFGYVLWVSMFATPFFVMPLCWVFLKIEKWKRIVIGLLLSFLVSFILYFASLAIIFRDGMGPE
jgi:hypothetical protein